MCTAHPERFTREEWRERLTSYREGLEELGVEEDWRTIFLDFR